MTKNFSYDDEEFSANNKLGENKLIQNEEIDLKPIYETIFRRKKYFLLTFVTFFLTTFLLTTYSRLFKPIYKGNFSVLINDPIGNNSARNERFQAKQESLFEDIAINSISYESETLIQLLKSPIFLDPIEEKFNLPKSSLSNMINIKQPKNKYQRNKFADGILDVSILINNKIKGKEILDELSKAYLNASLERRQQKLNDGLTFLDSQAPKIKLKLDDIQTKLVKFREKYKLIEPSIEVEKIKKQEKKIEDEIIFLKSERKKLGNVREEIINGSLTARGFKEEIGEGLTVGDFDQGLLLELINIEKELANATSKFTPSSKVIKGLKSRFEQIQPILLKKQLTAVDTALNFNKGRLSTLEEQKKEIEAKFSKQPKLIKEYENIAQELVIANQNILSLEKAREGFQLEIAQKVIPWRIISYPEMINKPIKPSFLRNLLTGSALGVLFGIIVSLIKDRYDNVFYTKEEVQQISTYPILADIPYINNYKNLLNLDISKKIDNKDDNYIIDKFFYEEAFRYLYTSINFLNINNDLKTISITSSIPAEGKTLICIFLCKIIASMGLKTLLIDADLRKPSIHKALEIENLKGLSDILITDLKFWEENVIKVSNQDNFDVILAGTIPPDASKLLGSQKFKDLIEEIKAIGKYDYIFINNTPILGLSDALLVSQNTDGVLLAVSLSYVNKNIVKESLARLFSIEKLNLLGLITNSTSENKDNIYSSYKKYRRNIQKYVYESYSIDKKIKDKENLEENPNNEQIANNKKNKFLNMIQKKIKSFILWLDEN